MSATAAAVRGVSLDGFMARHTSEDNASFGAIVERSNKRRKLAQPWLFEDPNPVRCGFAVKPALPAASCMRGNCCGKLPATPLHLIHLTLFHACHRSVHCRHIENLQL